MAHLAGRQRLRLLFCCREGLLLRLRKTPLFHTAAPFGVAARGAAAFCGQPRYATPPQPVENPLGVPASHARRPPGGTLGARQRKRPGASRSEKSAVGLIQRRQGLLIRYLGGLQLLGPLGFHLLELGLDRLNLLLDLGGIFRVGGQACLHAG